MMYPNGDMVNEEFVTIKEGIKLFLDDNKRNPSFIATVIRQGDLKSGTTKGKDWTNKTFTLQDTTDNIELTAWGDEISMLNVGYKYELTTPWWKEYDGKVQLGLGKWAMIKCVGSAQDTEAPTEPVTTPESETKPFVPPIHDKIPAISEALKEFVLGEDVLLLQIENVIEEHHKAVGLPPNGQRVGMHAREIYLQASKVI